MALRGSSSGELEIKSPADRFFKFFTDDINTGFDKISGEKLIESMDLEKRTVTMKMSGNLILDSLKTFKATFTVTPKKASDGSKVAWTVQFEKIHHDFDDPDWIINLLINHVRESDENLNLSKSFSK